MRNANISKGVMPGQVGMQNKELLKEYTRINESFKKKVIYHVGTDGGFHSEVDAMMECMLYCYVHHIRFELYADDANFSGGHGWQEFFEPFCKERHFFLHRYANGRYPGSYYGPKYHVLRAILKVLSGAKYLTSDVFGRAITREYGWKHKIRWDLFGVNGTIHDEFARLAPIALQYNDKTAAEVEQVIRSVGLPEHYASIQFRGGDKILERPEYMKTENVLQRIDDYHIPVKNLFIFSDDYSYVEEVKRLRPEWNLYTLTDAEEKGYDNEAFNKSSWENKRAKIIRLFAQIDVCLRSDIHLGYEFSCTNNYIRSIRKPEEYFAIVPDPELGRKSTRELNKPLQTSGAQNN